MRLNIRNKIIVFNCIVFGLASGCAKAPDKELAEAKAAIKAASDAEADKYMAKNFQNVLKGLEAAEAEIAKQKNSFFLFRKYTNATQLLKKTTVLAKEITREAPGAKQNMEETVRNNLSLADELIKITSNNIKKSSAFKNKYLIAALKEDLKTAEKTAASASEALKAGNILGASNEYNRFHELITQITEKISSNSTMVQFDEAEVQ
jgi:hypothetical protein